MTLTHELIRASAGTGKTFQLTNRFLELLDAGADPGTILATTFTRRAAGEIRDRVLERLAAAATDGAALQALREHVRADIDAARCRTLLARTVRDLHRINVRTLDAFFLRAALSFQLDLDTPPGWRIAEEDEDRALREAAIDDTLTDGEPAELFALLSLLFDGEDQAGVHWQLRTVLNDAYDIWRRAPGVARWTAIGPAGPPLDADALGALIARARRLDIPRKKNSDEPLVNWVRARNDLVAALEQPNADALGRGLFAKVLAGEERFSGREIAPEVLAVTREAIDHLAALLLQRLARRNEAIHDLLTRFHAAYEARKRRAATFRFDDLPALLRSADPAGRLDGLYYHLDVQCQHLLLDEFQDTSAEQFALLSPIAEEILAQAPPDRTFFCVGDEKQSLYGWRNAEPGLLPRLPKIWPGVLDERELARSYRSSSVILDTVNDVFSNLNATAILDRFPETRAMWDGFAMHESARPELGGAARLLRVVPDEDETPRQARIRTAARRVQAILAEAPRATVGVLVRKSKDIPWLLDALRRQDIEAAREGAGTLLDSPAVAAALAALAFADHPDHGLVRYHVASSALGPIVGCTDPLDRAAGRRAASRLRRRCAEVGCAAVLAEWQRACAGQMDERGFGRFGQLVAIAERSADAVRFRPSRLARIARERLVPEPDVAAVRVMTIHASKGLEFDAVVLPQLDDVWIARDRIVYERGADGGPVAVSYKPSKAVRAIDPRLQGICDTSRQLQFAEELCCLYVAMTRARHVLEMLVLPAPDSDTPRPGVVLEQTLGRGEAGPVLFERSRGDWPGDVARAADVAFPPVTPPRVRFTRPARAERPRLARAPRRSPSGLEGGRHVDLGLRFRAGGAGARRRGAVMHAWFAAIAWLDDGPPAPPELERIAHNEGARDDEVSAWTADFQRALERPDLQRLLRRPAGDVEVLRERRFAVRDDDSGEDVLLTGAFDRVTIERDASGITAIRIVDFKTDTAGAADLPARVEHYRPQMDAYRRAAARLWSVAPSRVTTTLLFTERGTAVAV